MANMFRVQAVWQGVGGSPYYSNWYFTSDGLQAGADAAQLDIGAFLTAISPQIHAGVTAVLNPEVLEISDADGGLVGAYSVTGGNIAGSLVSDNLPLVAQGLIQWRTGVVVSGRFLKGRMFVPGPCESQNDTGGKPTLAYISNVQAAAQDLVDSPDSQLRVWSRTHGTSSPVASAAVWSQWAELRSRRD